MMRMNFPLSAMFPENKAYQFYVSEPGDVDWFKIKIRGNCILKVQSEGDSSLDLDAKLYGDGGESEELDSDSSSGSFFVEYEDTNSWFANTYYLKVTNYNSATGPYKLRIKLENR